jgi:NADH-quinone oxidoreductase subunit J
LDSIISPILLLSLCAVGAIGLCLALPRRGKTPQVAGAAVAGLAIGAIVIALTLKNPDHAPNIYYYLFSAIALGSALRVITHPKPVYAALYFILTIIATAGLYLILSAEFVSFALIIVYAGAILITYLFVIMLASQSPAEEDDRGEADYDITAREPIAASVVGFLLLAGLSSLAFRGTNSLPATTAAVAGMHSTHKLSKPRAEREMEILTDMPRRLKAEMVDAGVISERDEIVLNDKGEPMYDASAHAVMVRGVSRDGIPASERVVPLPESVSIRNVEEVGFNLLAEHPGSIEIAGVILLMAMLGAVVLSRKQVELDEELKKQQARQLAGGTADGLGGAA